LGSKVEEKPFFSCGHLLLLLKKVYSSSSPYSQSSPFLKTLPSPPAILPSEATRIRYGSELGKNKGNNQRPSLALTESPLHWQLEDLWDLE
jgi:hypothetical protein